MSSSDRLARLREAVLALLGQVQDRARVLVTEIQRRAPLLVAEVRKRASAALPARRKVGDAPARRTRGLGRAFGMSLEEEAPAAPSATAHAHDAEFLDLLDSLGATAHEPDLRDELARRDATIAELQGMLTKLRGLGEELAHTEQARRSLEQRVRDLESALEARVLEFERALSEARAAQARAQDHARAAAAAQGATPDPSSSPADPSAAPLDVEKLLRDAERREGVLARERERHAATRAKLAEKKQVAAERWHELLTLRADVKRLERALAEASTNHPPAPLPGSKAEDPRTPLTALMQSEAAAPPARPHPVGGAPQQRD